MPRLFAVILILFGASFRVFADGPTVASVLSGACSGPSAFERSSATLVSFSDSSASPRSLVVAGDVEFADSEIPSTCFWFSTRGEKGVALRLIKRDSRMGLMLLEPTALISEPRPVSLGWSQYQELLWMGDFPVRLITTQSDRHFFQGRLVLHEYLSETTNLDFTIANGAPVGESNSIFSILSDESLLLRPGQAARPVRSRDLRFQPQGALLHRLAFASNDVQNWIKKILSGKFRSDLVLLSRPVGSDSYSKTLWRVRDQMIREVCERSMSEDPENNAPIGGLNSDPTRLLLDPSVLKDLKIDPKQFGFDPKDLDLQIPQDLPRDPLFQKDPKEAPLKSLDQSIQSGGIEPVGIGGLQNLLSDCRLATVSDTGATHAILLAYRRTEGQLQAHSLLNVQNFMNLQDSKDWKFLVQDDFLKGQGGSLGELRKASVATQIAVLNLYHTEAGNPLTLRQAFLVASLLDARDWKEITEDDIKTVIDEIENEMPLFLADDDLREDSDTEEFSLRKNQLVDSLRRLKGAREKCQ